MRIPNLSGATLLRAALLGTVLQTAMVVAGHSLPAVARLYAVLGVTISLVAGVAYALWSRTDNGQVGALGGAVAGGTCALIGIAISVGLGDVPPLVLGIGTASSAISGAVGGAATAAWLRGRGTVQG